MNASPGRTRSRKGPLLGAGLILVALGSLVWALTADGSARSAASSLPIARGAPIRSAVTKSSATDVSGSKSTLEKPKPKDSGGFQELKFAALSGFDYPKSGSLQMKAVSEPQSAPESPAAAPPSRIPAEVRAFDKQRVKITGFMNPIEFTGESVKSFALTSIPGGCCFAAIPRLNEWIVVTMPADQHAEYAYYDPVTIFGTISIGEIYGEGTVLSLYRMTPEKVDIGY